jgi:hypothetical protein
MVKLILPLHQWRRRITFLTLTLGEDSPAVGMRGDEKSSTKLTKNNRKKINDSWSNSEFEKLFEAVDADEIRRQKNSRALRRHLVSLLLNLFIYQ